MMRNTVKIIRARFAKVKLIALASSVMKTVLIVFQNRIRAFLFSATANAECERTSGQFYKTLRTCNYFPKNKNLK